MLGENLTPPVGLIKDELENIPKEEEIFVNNDVIDDEELEFLSNNSEELKYKFIWISEL